MCAAPNKPLTLCYRPSKHTDRQYTVQPTCQPTRSAENDGTQAIPQKTTWNCSLAFRNKIRRTSQPRAARTRRHSPSGTRHKTRQRLEQAKKWQTNKRNVPKIKKLWCSRQKYYQYSMKVRNALAVNKNDLLCCSLVETRANQTPSVYHENLTGRYSSFLKAARMTLCYISRSAHVHPEANRN